MLERIRVGVVAANEKEREALGRLLAIVRDIAVLVKTDPDGRSDLIAARVQVAVVGCSGDGEEAWQTAGRLVAEAPEMAVIKVVDRLDGEAYKLALRSGVKELVGTPIDTEELITAVYTAYEAAQPKVEEEKTVLNNGGRITSVFSTKGGVGKTTIAANLAVLLSKSGKKTALVDLDLESGDAALALDVVPRRSIVELADEINRLDIDLLESYLVRHNSGVMVLCAPSNPAYGKLIAPQHVEKMLRLLREEYDYVVVDAPNYFHETIQAALQLSGLILLVGNVEIFSVKNMRSCLDTLETMGMKEKVRILLNKVGREGGIKLTDIEQTLGMPVWESLPSEENVVVPSINQGIPLVMTHPNSRIGQGLRTLKDKVEGEKVFGPVSKKRVLPAKLALGGSKS